MIVVALALALTCAFAVAGLMKLADQARVREAVGQFGVPARLAGPVAVGLPLLEIVLAAGLLVPATARAAAASIAALLVIFSFAIARELAAGRAPDCACFGSLAGRVGRGALVRNAVLFAVAVVLLGAGDLDLVDRVRGLDAAERVGLAGAVILAAVVAAFSWLVLILLRRQGRLLLRLEAFEGSRAAPEFALRDVDGDVHTLADLHADGRAAVLIFTTAGCAACEALLPRVGMWQRGHPATVALVAVGTEAALRAKRDRHGLGLVLVDGGDVAARYGVQATPAAALVDAAGFLVVSPVTGEAAIIEIVAAAGKVPAIPAIGDPAPPLSGLAHDGRGALVVFWDPTCAACEDIADDLREWDGRSEPQLVIVTRGGPDVGRALGLRAVVVVDTDDATALAFGARGTPSAILVDGAGAIASALAEGRAAIRSLSAGTGALV